MPNLTRAISSDGSAFAIVVNSTAIINEMTKIHECSAVISAALGRLSTAAVLMGAMLKNPHDSLTLRINGGGPSGSLIAVANGKGKVKSYVDHPIVEIPLNSCGKLDVRGAVGCDGTLSVIKDIGLKKPYCGQVELVSGEIAEDITYYYAHSEQIPTVCALGVLVHPDLTIQSAGGYLIQLLPNASEDAIACIEKNIAQYSSVSGLFSQGKTPQQLSLDLLDGLKPSILDQSEAEYECDCSKSRVERILFSLGENEIQQLIKENIPTKVECHFCCKTYTFSTQELQKILDRITSNKGG